MAHHCRASSIALAFACTALQAALAEVREPTHGLMQHNRSLSISAVQIQQNYQEFDRFGLTPDGIFNAEQGRLRGWSVQARWQGEAAGLPLWAQASMQRSTGQTSYRGYLQSSAGLTPYQALTGNALASQHFRIGLPWQTNGAGMQLVPYLDLSQQEWQRNLVQYSETYRYRGASLGLLTQWQATKYWVLEASYQKGRHTHASASVPSLGFAADLGRGQASQASLAASYKFSDAWSLLTQVSKDRYSNSESAITNGLQAPPSSTRQTSIQAALTWHY